MASPERASRSPSLFYPRAAGARLVLDKLAATSPTAPSSPSGRQQIEAGRQQEAPFARARLAQLIALTMAVWLPESLQFLAVRRKDRARISRWLRRIDPSVPSGPDVEFVVHEENREGVPVVNLFRQGRGPVTVLLWLVNFMNLLNLYFLASWLPTVVRDAGHSVSTAVLAGTILQVGGTIGTVGLAWLIGRLGFIPVLTASFGVASVAIALIGQPVFSIAAVFVLVFIAGWCVVGGQPGINALAATFYPTYLRSTGVGWGLGVGRAGAIVGPVVGGEFMRRHWSTRDIFLAAAVPALISTLALLGLRLAMARRALRHADSDI